jgi:hypothetical protein
MKSHIVNCLDLEHDNGMIIEVGLTEVDLEKRKILKSYSYPVKAEIKVSDEVYKLTGWTTAKLQKRGEPIWKIYRRLLDDKGLVGRLMVVDSPNEWTMFRNNLKIEAMGPEYSAEVFNYPFAKPEDTLCVSSLWKIKHKEFGANTSLPDMLKVEGLEFEGKRHSAKDDSLNIARLFLELLNDI